MVSVSNVPIDGRVIRSAIALAGVFDSVRVIGFTRGERNPPEISNLEFDVFPLDEKSGSGLLASAARKISRFWILVKMAWRILVSKGDFYYSHEAHLLPIAWLAAKIRGAKLAYDIHEIYGEMGKGLADQILRIIEVPLIHLSDVLISTNIDRKSRIAQKNRIDPSRINVIRNLPFINPSPKSILDVYKKSGSLKCLYHGRLSVSDRALDVLVRVAGSMPELELVVIGIDSLGQRAILERIAQECPYQNTLFLDPLPPDQLVSFSTGADVGILSYRNTGINTALASPNKIWEYMASGLFILSTPFPEVLRILEECPCGTAGDITDERQLTYHLKRILNMSDLEVRKRAGKDYFDNNFSWAKEASKLQETISASLQS